MAAKTKHTGMPDQFEIRAAEAETGQTARLKKHRAQGHRDQAFWTARENGIFEAIKDLREMSKTYHPDNER